MVARLPGNPFVFVEFEEGGGVFEPAAFVVAAGGLDAAEGFDRLLELAGEAVGLDAEVREQAVGVHDGQAVGA